MPWYAKVVLAGDADYRRSAKIVRAPLTPLSSCSPRGSDRDKPRAIEKVARSAGDEHLAWTGERGHTRRRVNADASRLPADHFDLAVSRACPFM